MATTKIAKGYVKITNPGRAATWAVQIPDEDSRWGFYLATSEGEKGDWDSNSYDGGFGLADNREWKLVPETKVPKAVRARLSWLLEQD